MYPTSLSQKLHRRRRVFLSIFHKVPLIKSQGDAYSVVQQNRPTITERPACLNLKTELYLVDHVWSMGGGCGELNPVILLLLSL
jgi:hypothetical protein